MAREWMCLALTAGWLWLHATAVAQPPPPSPPANTDSNPTQANTSSTSPLPRLQFVPPPAPPVEPPVDDIDGQTQFAVPDAHIGFEYLLWWVQRSKLPPLVTRGSVANAIPGALGQNGTRVLLRGAELDNDHRHHGARFNFGIGLDNGQTCSFAGSFYFLESNNQSRSYTSDGSPSSLLLARPFFDIVNNVENADPVAFPGIMSGSIIVNQSRRVFGGDAAFRFEWYQGENSRWCLLLGGKAMAFDETLGIATESVDLPGQGTAGNVYSLRESFNAYSRFYGCTVGTDYEFRVGPFFLASTAKVSLGGSNLQANLRAFTSIREPNGNVVSSNDRALLVTPNNGGHMSDSVFAVVPEGSLHVGCDLNQYIRLSVGYTGFYLSRVYRSGDLINRQVNIQPVGTPLTFNPTSSPLVNPRTSGLVVQGLDAVLRFSF